MGQISGTRTSRQTITIRTSTSPRRTRSKQHAALIHYKLSVHYQTFSKLAAISSPTLVDRQHSTYKHGEDWPCRFASFAMSNFGSPPRSPASSLHSPSSKRMKASGPLRSESRGSSRSPSPDELAANNDDDNNLNYSTRHSRQSSQGIVSQLQHAIEMDDNRSVSPDELDHTFYESRSRDDTGRSSPCRDSRSPSRSRSRSVSSSGSRTPNDELNQDNTPGESSTPAASPSKPFGYRLDYTMRCHAGLAQAKFSPDGEWIATASSDKTAKIFVASTGKLVHTLVGHLAGISAISWSPDSRILATGSDDKTIRLWDLVTGEQCMQPWAKHSNYVFSLAFSPRGNMLASGSFDEALFLWDARTGHMMRSHPAHSDPIGSVDFTPDGTLIASCSSDGLIRIWDTGSGQCLRTIVDDAAASKVTHIRFSPNGKYILAWTLDNCIRLWDYVAGTCKKTYQGHKNEKYSIGGGFGVHGGQAYVVSPSEDGSIVFWDVKSKQVLQEIKAHDSKLMYVDVDQSRERILSASDDGIVQVWVPEADAEDQLPGITDAVKAVDLEKGVGGGLNGGSVPITIKSEIVADDVSAGEAIKVVL